MAVLSRWFIWLFQNTRIDFMEKSMGLTGTVICPSFSTVYHVVYDKWFWSAIMFKFN